VIAIIITVMVLELKVPEGDGLSALRPMWPVFLSYVLSFLMVAIYWNNHHHLMQAVKQVNGAILWANTHLLFWLSLMPFVTAWMGENHFAGWPVAIYGTVLLLAGLAYSILTRALVSYHGSDSVLAKSLGGDFKGNASLVLYVVALALALYRPRFSLAIYFLVAMLWLIPDRRIERNLR
jgi:uncharacterized membrane protein